MNKKALLPYTAVAVVVSLATVLSAVVVRSPDTHGHLWPSLPAGYERTPVDVIQVPDLPAITAELPAFRYQASSQPPLVRAAGAKPALNQPTGEAQRISILLEEFAILPERLSVKVGVPVELEVRNQGKQVHGVWIPDFGISEDLRSGKAQVFRFTPDQPGRIRMTCSYNLCGTEEEHARMLGFLTVQ